MMSFLLDEYSYYGMFFDGGDDTACYCYQVVVAEKEKEMKKECERFYDSKQLNVCLQIFYIYNCTTYYNSTVYTIDKSLQLSLSLIQPLHAISLTYALQIQAALDCINDRV